MNVLLLVAGVMSILPTTLGVHCKALTSCCAVPKDHATGQYFVKTGHFSQTRALCDMATDRGGWTVLMRRQSKDLSFDIDIKHYVAGFGNFSEDFWLGLQTMAAITSSETYEMRIDMYERANHTVSISHAYYDSFRIESGPEYTLRLGAFNGSDDDLLDNMVQFNGHKFQAKVEKEGTNCTRSQKGGWWYAKNCFNDDGETPGTVLTTRYPLLEWRENEPTDQYPSGERTFKKWEMKIRPKSCSRAQSTA